MTLTMLRKALIASGVVFGSMSTMVSASARAGSGQDRGTTRAEGRALLVGVNEYPQLGPAVRLHGPRLDVERVAGVLERTLGFDPAKMTRLGSGLEQAPTRANILAHLDDLARSSVAGELVVFYFAGHGSRVPDTDGDEHGPGGADGLDEVLLPEDTRVWDQAKGAVEGAIVDDELAEKLAAILATGARVWVVLDCCFSGTGLRGPRGTRTVLRRRHPSAPSGNRVLVAVARHRPRRRARRTRRNVRRAEFPASRRSDV